MLGDTFGKRIVEETNLFIEITERAGTSRSDLSVCDVCYSITSRRAVGGLEDRQPDRFGGLEVDTRSNLVGYCTGSSFTFAPRRRRSTYVAARRCRSA
jgi:hypothetical protein